jgi:hypothetical protein
MSVSGHSRSFPPSRVSEIGHARYLAEHIPNAKLIELPGIDHGYWTEVENLLIWRVQFVHRPALGVSSFSRAPEAAEISCMTCSILSCTP